MLIVMWVAKAEVTFIPSDKGGYEFGI